MRYIEVSETEVLDSQTGLIWQASVKDNLTYHQALAYAKKLSKETGFHWRVPSKEALLALIEPDCKNPASSFPCMPAERFWSCSKDEGCMDSACVVDFYDGRQTIMSCNWSLFVKLFRKA
jgi:hypothetical protein